MGAKLTVQVGADLVSFTAAHLKAWQKLTGVPDADAIAVYSAHYDVLLPAQRRMRDVVTARSCGLSGELDASEVTCGCGRRFGLSNREAIARVLHASLKGDRCEVAQKAKAKHLKRLAVIQSSGLTVTAGRAALAEVK